MSDRNYGALRSAEKFEKFVDRLISEGKPLGFDIESGYVGPDREKMALLQFHPDWLFVGFSFTNSTEWARYVPVAHDDGNNVDDKVRTAKALWRLLNSVPVVSHNASFELKGAGRWFRELLFDDPEVGEAVRESKGQFPILDDTMILVYLEACYDPLKIGKDLKSVTKAAFGHEMVHFMDLFPLEDTDMGPAMKRGQSKKVRFNSRYSTSQRVIDYACEDAVWCLALHGLHYENQKDQFIFRVEMDLIPVLIEMEFQGMRLDWGLIHEKAEEVAVFRDLMNEEIQNDLSERLGEVVKVNLGSPKQLGEILFDRLGLPVKERSEKTNAPSTGESALRAIAKEDPVIKRILEWREVAKLYGSYLHKYDTELNYAGTERAYPNHNQAGALTGRMSVDHVSYQQWPKPYHYELKSGKTYDLNFRDLFIAPEGFRIIGYDYSQVELRVLAGQANEKAMLEAFESGVDIHRATAATMFSMPVSEVTSKHRKMGKIGNFATVYQSGAQNMADMMGASLEEAKDMLEKYFRGFPNLRPWMDARIAEGREQGYVETLFGRKFTVWEYKDPRDFIRAKGDRMCVNAPIQGGAADYIKIAMVRAMKAIKKAGLQDKIFLITTVHDALEFYVHESVDTQTVIDLINPAVSFPVNGLPEIKADWHEGYRWGSIVELKLDKNKKICGYGIEDVDEEFSTLQSAYDYMAGMRKEKDEKQTGLAPRSFAPEINHALFPDKYPDPRNEKPLKEQYEEKYAGDEPPWRHAQPVEEDDTPMALSAPEPRKAIVQITEMPDTEQWQNFELFLKYRPGIDTVVLSTPEGDLEMDSKHSLSQSDQPEISLILGGASLKFVSLDVNEEAVMEGIDL